MLGPDCLKRAIQAGTIQIEELEKCMTPNAGEGKNSASKVTVSRVAGGRALADLLTVSNAVGAPPIPDQMPVEAGADVTTTINRTKPMSQPKTTCSGNNCPSKSNCHRYTMPRDAESVPAALYLRREAGDSACDLFLPINPVTTFKE